MSGFRRPWSQIAVAHAVHTLGNDNVAPGNDPGRLHVDYFNLATITFCHKGDVLAKIIPEQPGEAGMDVFW